MSFELLRDEALKLSPECRASLARDLLASLEDLDNSEVSRLWLEEAARRDDELTEPAAGTPSDDVLARARARLK